MDQQSETTLHLLSDIEKNKFGSQRSFSSRMGMAVGLTNAYIRRCMKKGWIKMSKAPARRYAYYLTPKGFTEKSRLTADYLASSFRFFREARTQCRDLFRRCEDAGWQRVLLYGVGDLTEIAMIAVRETNVTLVAIVGPESERTNIEGIPIVSTLDSAPQFDAMLVTETQHPQAVVVELMGKLAVERILIPPLLLVTLVPNRRTNTPSVLGDFCEDL